MKFDYGIAATIIVTMLVNMNGQVLRYHGKVQLSDFTSILTLLHCFMDCLQHLLKSIGVSFAVECLSRVTQKVGMSILKKSAANRL